MRMHTGCTDTVRESALKVDVGTKISRRTGDSNLRQRRDGPMPYQLRYIPNLLSYYMSVAHSADADWNADSELED